MAESQLMEKYQLSPQNLELVFKKLSQAGVIKPPLTEGPIPVDHALVPVEKKARDVPRDSAERRRRLHRLRREKKAQEESERLLKIAESRLHWWLLGVGLIALFTGTTLYLVWPDIAKLWFGDLALDQALGHHGSTQRTYELWHRISIDGGPIIALAGGMLALVALVKQRLNRRKMEKLLDRQRRGLVFSASRER